MLANLLEPQQGETVCVDVYVGFQNKGEVEEIWTASEMIQA